MKPAEDAAGAGAAGADGVGLRACRSSPTSTPSRSATAAAAIEALVRQVSSPVRWEDVMRRLASEGVRKYVEVGPGTVLTGLGRKIVQDATFANIEDPAGSRRRGGALLA